MGMIQIRCPGCQRRLKVDEGHLGKKGRCKACGAAFVIARQEAPEGAPASLRPAVSMAVADPSIPRPDVTQAAPDVEARSPVGGVAGAEALVPLEWNVGDVILDLYEVKQVHTGGGMGLVYRVHHRGWNLDLAVKSPRADFFQTDAQKQNFIRECLTWIGLGLYPHIACCYYVRLLGAIPRVFAEYVEGGSLKDWIDSKKLYEGGPDQALERILDIAIQFAWGLHYAHEQGLVHQDVKPANVLMVPDGTAKVTDFGLAKARGATAEQTAQGGQRSILVSSGGMTPAYCSPEQAEGQPVSRRTDVWSWGVSVLEMFAGGVTWLAGQAAAEALDAYAETPAEEEAVPRMPGRLAEQLRECFRRRPEERPGDFGAIVTSLKDIYREVTGQEYARGEPQAVELQADSLNNRAVSLVDLGRAEEAGTLWEKAQAASPKHPESGYNLALWQWRQGQITHQEAFHRLREIAAAHAGQWLPPYLESLLHLEQGNCEGAVRALESIGDREDIPEVSAALTMATAQLGNSRRLVRTFQKEAQYSIDTVCISRDGRLALAGGIDRDLLLYDVGTGRLLRKLYGLNDMVHSVSLSADGRLAVAGCGSREDPGEMKLWNTSSSQSIRDFRGHTKAVQSVHISVDGRWVVSGSWDGTIRIWDSASGKCERVIKEHQAPVRSVVFNADCRYILSSGDDGTVRFWDAARGTCLRRVGGESLFAEVGLSDDGRLAMSLEDENCIALWDTASGEILRTLKGHTDGVTGTALSADGRCVLSISRDKTLRLWEAATGRCLAMLDSPRAGMSASVSLTGDGRYAVSSDEDKNVHLWYLAWEVTAPYSVCRVRGSQQVLAARRAYEQALTAARAAAADGDIPRVAANLRTARSHREYRRRQEVMDEWCSLYTRLARGEFQGGWQTATFHGHADAVQAACLSPDRRYAVSAGDDETVRLWELASGKCLRTFRGHTADVVSLAISPDGRNVLSGSWDQEIHLWEVATGRCLRKLVGHSNIVRGLTLSSDGRYLLSCTRSPENSVKLWDVATGTCLRTLHGHTDCVYAVAWCADERHAVSGSKDQTLRLWDVATGECLSAWPAHNGCVSSVGVSADGRFVLSAGWDGRVCLWDVAARNCLKVFQGHDGPVESAAFSGDGRHVVSGGHDTMVKLWDVATGECKATLEGHTDHVNAVCLSADGRHALSASSDHTLKLWVLDWEVKDRQPTEWDEGVLPYVSVFLTQQTPRSTTLPTDRLPTEQEVRLALVRQGKPAWTDKDFERLMSVLACAGYGWLWPGGVRAKLEEMAADWQGPPPLPWEK